MIEFKTHLVIECPLPDVFAYWANPDNIPHWQSGVVSYRRQGDATAPVGQGTQTTVTRKALGMQQETHGEYTAFAVNQRLVEQVRAGPAQYTIDTRFSAQGSHTRVDVHTRLSLGGVMGRLGEKMALRPIQQQAKSDHARIKQILEQR